MGGGAARLSTVLLGAALPEGWWRGTTRHCTARLQNINKNCHNPEANIIICYTSYTLVKTRLDTLYVEYSVFFETLLETLCQMRLQP